MDPDQPNRAIIYMRSLDRYPALLEHCAAHGYEVIGVVLDGDGSRYQETQDAMVAGQADVLVACEADIPADRVPRVEAVPPSRPLDSGRGRTRRPRLR